MKVTKKDLKHNIVGVQVQNLDDLWYLSHIVDRGDSVKARTVRKIKLGDEGDRKAKVIKKPVTLTIVVDKIEFKPEVPSLRISGNIKEGMDDISAGSHHSFNIDINDVLTITKEKWLSYQLDKLDESQKEVSKVLICVLDREEVSFALLKKFGYELLSEFTGEVPKKDVEQNIKKAFFDDIITALNDYVNRYKIEKIIVASPGFWKKEFEKFVPDELKKSISYATCSTAGKAGIDEVLKRDEVKSILADDRTTKEIKAVEELLSEISKQGNAAYGIKETENAVNAGAVKTLLITDDFLFKAKEEGKYERLDTIMKTAESTNAKIMLVSSKNDGGKKLDGLGGIGAVLRYALS